ncbi:MAG: tetraacyldisaccharide 4'-kinase [Alphaproteobacteria bacterium]|nr:MAG: tetraacyldisaccharide 4'-kinase [Alphaproteobacteria bacterium]
MRAPAFWTRPPGLLARALAPLGAGYALATRLRLVRPGLRLPVPVICVGNLTAGGSGKTPLVIALVERLAARGVAVHVLSRGHGGRLRGPLRVDPVRHRAADVGDEPLLLAAFAPVWVARDRAAGGRAACAAGAQVIVMDDGFQNPALVKDLSLLVVDAETGFGNGLCIPAGPLREPLSAGLARADLVVAVGADPARLVRRWPQLAGRPLVGARIVARETGMPWQGQRVVAFAGIGRPKKFFATLRGLGAEIVAAHPLGDHAPLSPRLLARLVREAEAQDALLVTTDKDAVRLPRAFRGRAVPVPVDLRPEAWGPIDAALDSLLAGKMP